MSITRLLGVKRLLSRPVETILELDALADPDDVVTVPVGVVSAERKLAAAGERDHQFRGRAAAVAAVGHRGNDGGLGRQQAGHIALLARWRCVAVQRDKSVLHHTALALSLGTSRPSALGGI